MSYTLFEVALLFLNQQSAQRGEAKLPKSISELRDSDYREKSLSYTQDKTRVAIASTLYGSLVIFLFVFFSVFGLIDEFLRTHIQHFYLRGCLYVIGISLLFSIIKLPFNLYTTFIIEQKYGFNNTTISLWISDTIKGFLLSLTLTTPLLLGVLYFVEAFPKIWWLLAFGLLAGFQLILLFLYPVLIAPLFNKFKPLEDKALGEEISALADKLTFESEGIYQMDGSRRSTHGNAYFAGFGKLRRIVLFDTLIEILNSKEICAVLAHEIGHAKKKHVLQSICLSMLFLFITFYVASLLLESASFFNAFGIEIPSSYGLLILVSVAFEPILFFVSPITSVFSRKNEYEADRYAVDAMGGANDLEHALAKLSTESLSNLSPHPWYSFFHYSHPSLLERISAMNSYADK